MLGMKYPGLAFASSRIDLLLLYFLVCCPFCVCCIYSTGISAGNQSALLDSSYFVILYAYCSK
ncbi:hypothetical protein Fmac_007379 [Flemingia macrophylla]|uniref:NADH dehydrogenase subunit 1 n=1 Tax=Flemingia macrophylla TaxID=520843 RepID=A0ABD1MUE3_9FABA